MANEKHWSGHAYRIAFGDNSQFFSKLTQADFMCVTFIAASDANWTPGMMTTVTIPVADIKDWSEFRASAPLWLYSDAFPDAGYFITGGVEVIVSAESGAIIKPTYLNWAAINGDNPQVQHGLPAGMFYCRDKGTLADVVVRIEFR